MAKEKEPKKNEETAAPKFLRLTVTGPDGEKFGEITAEAKEFSTGSKGFYASGKVVNPRSAARYQLSCNIPLIGSKPEESKGAKKK